jgi:hypothetical protein
VGLCEGGQGGEKGGRDIGGVSRINAGCKFFSLVFLGENFLKTSHNSLYLQFLFANKGVMRNCDRE